MTWTDLVNQIKALVAQVTQSKSDAAAKIASLEAQLAQASKVTAEGEAALASLEAAVQALDDLVP
jgi:hypothetical protein